MQEKTIDLRSVFPVFRAVNQPLVFTWLGAVLCAVFFYAITASSPLLGNIAWSDAARFGTQWWLTSFGAHLSVGQGTLSLIPSLYTAIIVFSAYFAMRRIGIFAWSDVAFAAGFTALTIAVIGLISSAQGPWWIAIIGGGISFAAVATWAGREELLVNLPWWPYLTRAWRILRVLLIATALATVTVFVIAFIAGIGNVRQINDSYFQNAIGTASMVLVQLMYLPAYLLWTLAWILGAGFSVGVDTSFAITGNSLGPLPAIPVFGALPGYTTGYSWLIILPILAYVVLGAVAMRLGWLINEQSAESASNESVSGTSASDASTNSASAQQAEPVTSTLGRFALNAVIAGVLFVFICSLSALVAAGSIGPGRMTVVGSQSTNVAAFSLLIALLPFALGAVIAHPATIAQLKTLTKGGVLGKVTLMRKREADAGATGSTPDTSVAESSPSEGEPVAAQPVAGESEPASSQAATTAPDVVATTPDAGDEPGVPATPDVISKPDAATNKAAPTNEPDAQTTPTTPASQDSEEKRANADTKPETASADS
ncbi:DUF6350 family protein [Arcanobacterium bovis]|nr:DUF6350 family protein [Arcanobacterium bovis]